MTENNKASPGSSDSKPRLRTCDPCKGTGDSRGIPHPAHSAWNRRDMGCRVCHSFGYVLAADSRVEKAHV